MIGTELLVVVAVVATAVFSKQLKGLFTASKGLMSTSNAWNLIKNHYGKLMLVGAFLALFGVSGVMAVISFTRDTGLSAAATVSNLVNREADPVAANKISMWDMMEDDTRLTNDHGWYNFALNLDARTQSELLVRRTSEAFRSCNNSLNEAFAAAGSGISGSMQWQLFGTMVDQTAEYLLDEPVMVCSTVLRGKMVNLVYPGNIDANKNGNGLSATTIAQKAQNRLDSMLTVRKAVQNPCAAPFEHVAAYDNKTIELNAYRGYQLEVMPNQPDLRWSFTTYADGNVHPIADAVKPQFAGKIKHYLVQSINGTKPAFYRLRPVNCS